MGGPPPGFHDSLEGVRAMKLLIQAVAVSVVALAAGAHHAVAQVVQPRPAAEVRLSVESLLSIGLMEGADEYLFAGINGGALLADGSVVISDRGHFRIQKFGPDGKHLWSRGREGEGPGEFEYVQVAPGCARAAGRIVVYDIWTARVSVFSDEGELLDDYPFLFNGLPLRRFSCAPNGRLVFAGIQRQDGRDGR